MDLSRGYDLPGPVQERLRLLDWIADNGGTVPGVFVSLAELFEGKENNEAQAIAGTLDALQEEGLIKVQATLGWGGYTCTVTPAGLDLIEDLRNRRGDLLGRRKASRDAFLKWLHDSSLRGNTSPVTSAFGTSRFGTYYGHTFTDDEIKAAGEWLKAEGYLDGEESWGGGVLRPTISTRGERLVESSRSVNDDSPVAANAPTHVTNVTVTGSHGVNVAAHSPGAVQSATVNISDDNRQQILAVARALDGLLQAPGNILGLDEETTADARTVVAELDRAAGQPTAETGALRQLLEKAKTVAIAGTGAAVGHGVVALVHQALQGLGLA